VRAETVEASPRSPPAGAPGTRRRTRRRALALVDRIAYRPGGSDSIDFSTETICACSFFATLPDTKMPRWPDVFVEQADDHLAARLDLLGRAVDVGDPVERLLRRRDVVAHRREQDDRRLDVAQVEAVPRPPRPPFQSLLPTKRLRVIHSISSRFIR
jgi:hypothetical protein